MTKKKLRLAVAAGIAVLTMAASSVSALAVNIGNYSFNLPSSYTASYTRYSSPRVSSGARAYVNQ
jgi:hypothetical protein